MWHYRNCKQGGVVLPQEVSLSMQGISKRFPGVIALDDVNLNVKQGSVHCIVGENGAGKSTLMKILSGLYIPDTGDIFIDGECVEIKNPLDALRKGVSIIQQELSVAPELTVAEVIFLNREPMLLGGLAVDKKGMIRRAQDILSKRKLNIGAETKMKELSIAQKQMVEIAKSVSFNARVIIMDEPTSAISDREVEELFRTIKELKSNNVSVIYISHKMEELEQIADDVTILRDGKYIGTWPMSELSRDKIISMMVGRDLTNRYPKTQVDFGETVLEVKSLCAGDGKSFKDISFSIRAGEIYGLAGLMGAGRTEVARAIFGMDAIGSGDILMSGGNVTIKSPTDAIKNGIVMVTEDRRKYGVVLCRSILENISLPNLDMFTALGFHVNKKKEKAAVKVIYDKLSIKSPTLYTPTSNLSGGNQQKVVLAKWLMANPKLLILDEPTRGIDVGAKYEIYQLMTQMAKQGIAILFISSELPEILGMCDNVTVMCEGKAATKLEREELNQETIMRHAVGSKCAILEERNNG